MRPRLTTLALAVALLASAGTSSAQQASTSTTAAPLTVRLQVIAAPGIPATVAIRNGALARWTRTDGTQYGLTPVVVEGQAELHIFSITPGKTTGAEKILQLGTLTLERDKPVMSRDSLFEVTLLGVAPIPTKPPQTPAADGPCTTCCVTCGEWTVCACAVQMDCGSCCCKDHCSCFGDGVATTGCAVPAGSESTTSAGRL